MKKFAFAILFIPTFCWSQKQVIFPFEQPSELLVDAGGDIDLEYGLSIELGGTPTAQGGTSDYTYIWSPNTYLDDPTIANPTSTPIEDIAYTLEINDGKCKRTDEIILKVFKVTSIEGTDLGIVTIYPNPSSGLIRIKLPKNLTSKIISIELRNMQGQLLKTTSSDNKTLLEIEINDIASGSYLLILRGEGVYQTHEFILK